MSFFKRLVAIIIIIVSKMLGEKEKQYHKMANTIEKMT